MNLALKRWIAAATVSEQATLAERAGTSRNHLYQLSGGHRGISADLAGRIAKEAERLRKSNPELPRLKREQLCPACRACEYQRSCNAA